MLLPINWLEKFVDINTDVKTLSDKITDSGSHVDEIIVRDSDIEGVVTGKIIEINPHPDADKLVVCMVDVGDEILQIVTGAPNVVEGVVVPVAKVGAVLPGDKKIGEADMRGVISAGMLCSPSELGFNISVIPREFRDGIWLLGKDTELGVDINKALNLDSEVLDVEITPNRPDCLSIYGMARETSASLKTPMKERESNNFSEAGDIKDYLYGVTIDTPFCERYIAKVIDNVDIKPSPQWMKNDLMAAGIRPINNIVDITNYVMLEYGLPLHAFDLDALEGSKIRVYQPSREIEFETLDGKKRKILPDDIMIGDVSGPIGIAGVMGGLDSEITSKTKRIVIEAAFFEKSHIRKTSKRLNLRSEASSRFEKGLDIALPEIAINRVCELAYDIGVGDVVGGIYDVIEGEVKDEVVNLRPSRASDILGVEISKDEIIDTLKWLDFKVEDKGDILECTAPIFRPDITIEEDLIEEIGRFYSYNKIGRKPIKMETTLGGIPRVSKLSRNIKNTLVGIGYYELLTYSFVSPKTADRLIFPDDDIRRDTVVLENALGEEYSEMRTTLLGNILDVVSRNQNRNIEDFNIFEIGNTFSPIRDEDNIPTESLKLAMASYGDTDFYFLKESVERVLDELGIRGYRFERESENGMFHPGRCANIYINDEIFGTFGEIHPSVMDNFEIKWRTYAGEFDFRLIEKYASEKRKYHELPKYPASQRDLAVIVDKNTLVGDIKKVVHDNSNELMESFEIFDIYTGEQIEDGKKSVAFNMTFRSKDRTLKDEDVNEIVDRVIASLKDELGAILRDK